MSVVVPGDGPMPCDLMFLGETPGTDELVALRPFVGKSGQELDRFLDGISLPFRSHVYVTNVCKESPKKKTPDAAEVQKWLPELWDEIALVNPRVLVTLGATATKVLLGPNASIERMHGLAHHGGATSYAGIVFPTYHPAAALHAHELQSMLVSDFEALGQGWRHGFTPRPADPYRTPRYSLLPNGIRIPRAFSVDTEGWADAPWCITISWKPGIGYLIPWKDTTRLRALRYAARHATRFTCHSLLADLPVLAAMKVYPSDEALDDTMVMAYNLQTEPQGLKDLVYRWLGAEQDDYRDIIHPAEQRITLDHLERICSDSDEPRIVKAAITVLEKVAAGDERPALKIWKGSKFSQVTDPVPRATLDDVPRKRAVRYACRDADLTERLRGPLHQRVVDRGLAEVYQTDMAVMPVVNAMQMTGMRVDLPHYLALLDTFDRDYVQVRRDIERLIGQDLNPNSHPQVRALLFEELGLPGEGVRKTKSGLVSTQDKYLEAMRDLHPVIPLIIDGRELTKLKGAYCAAILDHAEHRTGADFIFPHLRITRVVSGRVSSFDPNVLAIPKHSARGKRIRMGFVAAPGCWLYSWDLSQIEMRVMAHESQDAGMLKVYREGKIDLHADLGERIFGIKAKDQDESTHRLPMKKANFGDIMGISGKGLHEQLAAAGVKDWSVDDCRRFLKATATARPGVEAYKQAKHRQAQRHGYVTDFLGRRRYLEGIHSPHPEIRAQALRHAQATPIQAGAQEVFKTWMAAVWRDVIVPERRSGYVAPWLQVHDDLILEGATRVRRRLQRAVPACIPQMLSVPVTAKGRHAGRWGEL